MTRPGTISPWPRSRFIGRQSSLMDTGTELNVFELTQVESSWQARVAQSFQREMQRDGSIMMLPSDN
jgi:hypothetical protein